MEVEEQDIDRSSNKKTLRTSAPADSSRRKFGPVLSGRYLNSYLLGIGHHRKCLPVD